MTERALDITNVADARAKTSDIEVYGDGDLFQLISKASSREQGWMKSTKAMDTGNGCVVQVTTQQLNPDGSWSVAEALTFVPGAEVQEVEGVRSVRVPIRL